MLNLFAETVFNSLTWLGQGNNSMLAVIVILMVIAVANFKPFK